MRIALITLAVAALAFIGSIIWTILPKVGDNTAPTMHVIDQEPETLSNIQIDIIKTNQKLYDKVESLEEKIDFLTRGTSAGSMSTSGTGDTSTEKTSTSTGTTASPIKISGKFLSLVMPTADLKLQPNKGIYDIFIFDSLPYSTYFDSKLGLKVMAIEVSYDAFLKNMKTSVREVYSINETKTFPFRSFYVNSIKPDTLTRIVIESETQTIALEIPKTKFPILKALLLKKIPPTPVKK